MSFALLVTDRAKNPALIEIGFLKLRSFSYKKQIYEVRTQGAGV